MYPEITKVISSIIAAPPADKKCVSVKEAVEIALQTPPQSYGLSTEYAHRRYRAYKRGKLHLSNQHTARLWEELAAKVDTRMKTNPNEDDFAAIDHILAYDRPSRYFLTPLYAEKLFYRRRRPSRPL